MKKIGKYVFPIFFALWINPILSFGQKNTAGAGLHEFGVGIGGINYTGELADGYYLKNYRPGGMIFYRFNISPVVSLRGSLLGGAMGANEKKNPDPVPQVRQGKFSSQLTELALTFEYNFLNYRPVKNDIYKFSPFFTAGLCAFNTKTAGGFQVGVPIGVGLKYNAGHYLNFGFEMVARKTFTDKLDGIKESEVATHHFVNPFDKDWYYYTGISISWTIYSVECPKMYYR